MYDKKRLMDEGWVKVDRLWKDPYGKKLWTYQHATNIVASRKGMVPADPVKFLMDIHYRWMEKKDFWYDKALIEADSLICKAASELRAS